MHSSTVVLQCSFNASTHTCKYGHVYYAIVLLQTIRATAIMQGLSRAPRSHSHTPAGTCTTAGARNALRPRHARTHTHAHARTHTYKHKHKHKHTHTHTHGALTHTHRHRHTDTKTHVHTYTHTQTHAQTNDCHARACAHMDLAWLALSEAKRTNLEKVREVEATRLARGREKDGGHDAHRKCLPNLPGGSESERVPQRCAN
jgi:hypothetical protein